MLESHYEQSGDDIVSMVEHLLQAGQLEVMEPEIVWRAPNDYKNSNVDINTFLRNIKSVRPSLLTCSDRVFYRKNA